MSKRIMERSSWGRGLLAAALLCTSGCTDFFSGGQVIPVAPRDAALIEAANTEFFAPNLTYDDGSERRPIEVMSVAFDGTLNDERRVAQGERATIISYIAGRVPGTQYAPGVGMQGRRIDNLDAALGSSMVEIAQKAEQRFFEEVDRRLLTNPAGQFRVFVTGFSRGAASARHFMNIVDDHWHQRFAAQGSQAPVLQFYTLLYDTVSTQLRTPVRLALPSSVNYSLHFVARDEPRGLFPVDIDEPTSASQIVDGFARRVNTIFLPGAHSDIGASYATGVGDNYRLMTDIVLSQLGLIADNCFDNLNDSLSDGKHDSRGTLDKLLGARQANTVAQVARVVRKVVPEELSPSEYTSIRRRLDALVAANEGHATQTNSVSYPAIGFTAVRSGRAIELLTFLNTMSSAQLVPGKANGLELKFTFRGVPYHVNTLPLAPAVVARITAQATQIQVTYLNIPGGRRYNIFVDDVLVDHVDQTLGKVVRVNEPMRCKPPALVP